MGNFSKNIAVWIIISLVLIALFNIFQDADSDRQGGNVIAYSDFLDRVETGEIKQVIIDGDKISGKTNDGRPFYSFVPRETELAGDGHMGRTICRGRAGAGRKTITFVLRCSG